MGKEADGATSPLKALCCGDSDGLLPEEASLGDLDRERGAAEIVREFSGVDACPDPVGTEVGDRVELNEVDGAGNRFPGPDLDRLDFVIGVGRWDGSTIKGLHLEAEPLLPLHIREEQGITREVRDPDRREKRLIGDVKYALDGKIDQDLGMEACRKNGHHTEEQHQK